MFRKIAFAFAALLAATACMPLSAQPLVEMTVVDRDNGDWLPQYRHRGDAWIAGVPGHRYAVRLTNTTGRRVLVVLSVDGVNAVTGQTAGVSQDGYVLDPWETAEIDGWRKSLEEVAGFVFTDLGDSYAARTGRPQNVGVIGVAVFEEARPRYFPAPPAPIARNGGSAREEAERQAAAPAAESRAADASRQSVGTGHGQREWSPVGETAFRRASRSPAQVSELRYDEERRLVALGVLPRPQWRPRNDAPRAFPSGFVADPPGRR